MKVDGTLLTGMLIGAAFVTTGGAVAGFGLAAGHAPRYAEVVDVRPVTRTASVAREVCVEISGAKRSEATRGARRQCRTVEENVPRVEAYDVSYRLDDAVEVVRLPEAPGSHVLVQDGRVRFEPVTRDGGNDVAAASG